MEHSINIFNSDTITRINGEFGMRNSISPNNSMIILDIENDSDETIHISLENELDELIPRKIHTWVDDNVVTACYLCKCEFGILNRKHHCRLCGKIFCDTCSQHNENIPNNLLSDDSKRGTWMNIVQMYMGNKDSKKHRVCDHCHGIICKINRVKQVVEVFDILELNLIELKKVSEVCELWKQAVDYLRCIFRETQYKLPTDDYSMIEKQMFVTNIKYLQGHSKYLYHLYKAFCDDPYKINIINKMIGRRRITTCKDLVCAKDCSNYLTAMECVNILCHAVSHNCCKELLISILNNLECDDDELECYLPILMHLVSDDPYECISTWLLKRCISPNLLHHLYWEIKTFNNQFPNYAVYERMNARFKTIIAKEENKEFASNIMSSSSLINVIQNVVNKYKTQENPNQENIQFNKSLTMPLNPNILVNNIIGTDIKIKKSATNPVMIPFSSNNGIYKLIHKSEDVRKDQIVIKMLKLVDLILKRELNEDYHITMYNVLPLDTDEGLIEIVPDSETMYYIQTSLEKTILNYILEHNSDSIISDVLERYLKSTAVYCVVTYLLGVGDRHLDNMMVKNNGTIFHIDFGYMLGKDPVFTNPGIRITDNILDALGGIRSEKYKLFQKTCSKIFNTLRHYIDIFTNMLLVLPSISDLKLSKNDIREQILRRFIPGENNIDAEIHMVNQLDRKGYDIYNWLKDFAHYHHKEETITGGVNKLAVMFTSFWDTRTK